MGAGKSLVLTAVTSGSEENKSFAKYIPSGKLKMYISPETQAANYFEPGKEYCLLITEAVPPVPPQEADTVEVIHPKATAG